MHDYAHHGFGIALTVLALLFIVGALRHRRWHRAYGFHHYGYGPGFGPGCGPHGAGHWGYGHSHGFKGHGLSGGMLRHLLWRLDTAPGQEKAVRAAVEDFRERMKVAKKNEGQDYLVTFQSELEQLYRRVLETLDDKQKKELADLLASRF